MAVDNNGGSPFYGSVYVTWVQFNGFGTHSPVQVAYSRDGARTFSTPVQVTKGPIRNNQDARIAIGPDGTLYLTFDNGIQGGKGTANYVAVSQDGGATWTPPSSSPCTTTRSASSRRTASTSPARRSGRRVPTLRRRSTRCALSLSWPTRTSTRTAGRTRTSRGRRRHAPPIRPRGPPPSYVT